MRPAAAKRDGVTPVLLAEIALQNMSRRGETDVPALKGDRLVGEMISNISKLWSISRRSNPAGKMPHG